jgi:hypothetical protein
VRRPLCGAKDHLYVRRQHLHGQRANAFDSGRPLLIRRYSGGHGDAGAHYSWAVELTKAERNAIFRAVEQGGLDPVACDLDTPNDLGFTINHAPSGSTFAYHLPTAAGVISAGMMLYRRAKSRPVRVQVDTKVATDPLVTGDVDSWDELLGIITKWAREIVDFEQIPDLWVVAKTNRALLARIQAAHPVNDLFSANERAEIANRVGQIKQQARKNPELTAEQVSGIEQKLDDLKEASERVGRKDWLTMLYGAAFGLIVNDTVPPHVVQSIITSVVSGLGHLFGLGGMPPSVLA